MSKISSAAVMALRELTQLPMMDCKRALEQSDGNQSQAIEFLRKRGSGKLGERMQNPTSEGRIHAAVSEDGRIAAMVELQCESAPVAKSETIQQLLNEFVRQLIEGPGASSPDELLRQTSSSRPEVSLNELFFDVSNQIREKLVLSRVVRVTGPAGAYVHHDGKSGVIFQATGNGAPEVLRDVAMHIAAMRPKVSVQNELPATVVQEELNSALQEASALNKPPEITQKIVAGRMKTFFRDQGVLTEQPFVMNEAKTVGQTLAESGFTPLGFTCWILGVDHETACKTSNSPGCLPRSE